jgi:plastocyanin
MRSARIIAAASLLILVVAALATSSGQQVHAQDQAIVVGDYYFCSVASQDGICETAISQGDTAVWTNVGPLAPHTVTECDDTFSTCPPSGGFNSGNMSNGDVFSHTFNAAGAFEYRCALHPSQMRGRIVVSAQPTPTPTSTPTATPAPAVGPTQIATPTATPVAGPAAIPGTGGAPSDGVALPQNVLLALATGILMTSASLILRLARRARG